MNFALKRRNEGGLRFVPGVDPFDPRQWLASLGQIGGRYALVADRRLWIDVHDCDGEALTSLISQIVGHADRQDEVKRAIECRQSGEA